MSNASFPTVLGYVLVNHIGGGSFLRVYRAVNVSEHRVAACKLVAFTATTTEKDRKIMEREIRVHSVLKHTNVLEFMNAVVVEKKHGHLYVPGMYILLEFASGGDLFDKIAAEVGVSEDVARFYFNQLVAGMAYIHTEGVCHRDLKPENLLLDGTGTLKICDFGLCAVFRLKESGKTRQLTDSCGSLPYVAPEVTRGGHYDAEPIDVWSMGIILFALLTGETPWDEPTEKSPEFRSFSQGAVFEMEPWNRIQEQPMLLIRQMLAVVPLERPTISAITMHYWTTRHSDSETKDPGDVAAMLTHSIRENGDMALISAPSSDGERKTLESSYEAEEHLSQFTKSLMLFCQTQNGQRYTPHLTRFYARLDPSLLMELIEGRLGSIGVQCKALSPIDSGNGVLIYRLRIGGFDHRQQPFKGWVDVEVFTGKDFKGSFCLMKRDEGCPISWRMLWKLIIHAEGVEPFVMRS